MPRRFFSCAMTPQPARAVNNSSNARRADPASPQKSKVVAPATFEYGPRLPAASVARTR